MHFFQQILVDLGIKYTVPFARTMFEGRSDSGSLYGIKKMLETYGCSMTAIRAEAPIDLDYPCICLYHGYFSVLKKEPTDVAAMFSEPDSSVVALVVNDVGAAREPDYLLHRMQQLLQYGMPWFIALMAAFLVIISFFPSLFADTSAPASSMQRFFSRLSGESAAARFDWLKLSLVVLNGLGIFFSYRTVARECSGTCHNVLESPASKLFGVYSLGVIGLSYFISSLIIVLFIPALAPVFALICCAALAMPLWSISYQAFVVRSWCRNCLGVQGVLLLTFAAELLLGDISLSALHWAPAITAIAIYFVVFYVCYKFYSLVQKEKALPKNLISNYRELLKNPQIKEQIIADGKPYNISGASNIFFGEPSGREILLIISPFCSHCRDLFQTVERLISEGSLKGWRISLLFTGGPSALSVYSWAIYEYLFNGPEAALKLLDTWYKSFKINKFRKHFEAIKASASPETMSALESELDHQRDWLDASHITSTPAMIVDGHLISHLLIEDIIKQ